MTDTRSPHEIEREIEREREGLRHTIEDIEKTFSPDNIMRSVTDTLRTNGNDIGRSVSNAVRDNPLAVALTGIGIGWLMFGNGPSADRIEGGAYRARGKADAAMYRARAKAAAMRRGSDDDDHDDAHDYAATRGTAHAGAARGTVYGGTRTMAHDPAWMSESVRSGPSAGQRMRDGLGSAGDRMRKTGQAASDSARSAADSARSAAGSARDSAMSTAGSARASAAGGAQRVRERSSEVARRLSEGTERMSEQARERVIAAREQAVLARERAQQGLKRGADQAVDFFEEHPLVAGALAFAVGAAIGGTLPRTDYEDEYFGEESDRLYDEAERIFNEEREKAERVAGAAMDEAKQVGEEARADAEQAARDMKDKADRDSRGDGSAADAAADRAKEATQRVTGAAKQKAKEEDLGRSQS